MRIVSPILKTLVYPALSSAGIFRRSSASGLAIVTYHGVVPPGYAPVDPAFDGNLITAEMLRRQLRLLKRNYEIISPEEVLAWLENGHTLPRRAVLVTCDDGLLNCLTHMLPVLQEEKVKCLFFVTAASAEASRTMLWYEELFLIFLRAPAGLLELRHAGVVIQGRLDGREQRRSLWWKSVNELSQLSREDRDGFMSALRQQFRLSSEGSVDLADPMTCRRYGLLTCTELRELVSAGMTIGAHTITHPILSRQPLAQAQEEISGSCMMLEKCLQNRVWAFAYPFGDAQSISPQVLGFAQQAGFRCAFLNFGGGLGSGLPAFALPRIHVTTGMGLAEFEAHVSGFYARFQQYRNELRGTELGAVQN